MGGNTLIMSPDKDELLCNKYPEIFKDRYADMTMTAMCWGFECGNGWFKIIDELCQELMDLSTQIDPPVIPVATQVKEKFGTLRFYVSGATDAQFDAIDKAESKSAVTCEVCGEPGKMRGKSWLYTACDEHTDPNDLFVDNTD